MEEVMVSIEDLVINIFLRNFVTKKTIQKLEQENKELKEELKRRMRQRNSIDVEYKIVEFNEKGGNE